MMPSVMLRDSSVVRSAPIRRRRRRWPLVVALTAVAAAAAIAALLLRQPASADEPPRSARAGDLKDELQTLGDNLRSLGKSARSLGEELRVPVSDGGGEDGGSDSDLDGDEAATETAPVAVEEPTLAPTSPSPEAKPSPRPRNQRRKPEPAPQPTPTKAAPPEEAPARDASASAPGYYSVDSRPYASIFIDGVSHGETPLYRVRLAPGTHQVRAVRADGTSKTYSISIAAGKEVSSGQLRW